MESNWKTLKYANTQQTGPAAAIEAEAKKLEARGVAFTLEDYHPRQYEEDYETREGEVKELRRKGKRFVQAVKAGTEGGQSPTQKEEE